MGRQRDDLRRSHRDVADWAGSFAGRDSVIICQKGLKLSQGTAAFIEFGWTPTTDAWSTLNGLLRSFETDGRGTFNAGRYSNPQLDALIDAVETAGANDAEVQAKMVDGAIAKFAKENALLSQLFVMDNKTPVAQVVEAAGKAAGTKIVLKDYVRFQLGEGIEKAETDFAAEVAAAAGLN